MRNVTINFSLLLAAGVGFAALACGDTAPGRVPPASTVTGTAGAAPTGTGAAGAAPTGTTMGAALVPDATGWVDGAGNSAGVQGAWFGYNDCNDSPGDCTTEHMVGGVPSVENSPDGFPNTDGVMCTTGNTAIVATEEEYSTKWGAGIALELASPGGEGATPSPFDATGFTGFAFTFTNNGANPVRVNLTNPELLDSHYKEISTSGNYNVTFAEVMQGSWVASPVPFKQDQILAIQFQVPSVMGTSVPFNYCVSNLSIY